jgi:hypothetical protein
MQVKIIGKQLPAGSSRRIRDETIPDICPLCFLRELDMMRDEVAMWADSLEVDDVASE